MSNEELKQERTFDDIEKIRELLTDIATEFANSNIEIPQNTAKLVITNALYLFKDMVVILLKEKQKQEKKRAQQQE